MLGGVVGVVWFDLWVFGMVVVCVGYLDWLYDVWLGECVVIFGFFGGGDWYCLCWFGLC